MYPDKTQIITTDNVQKLGEIIATCALKAVFRMSNSETLNDKLNPRAMRGRTE